MKDDSVEPCDDSDGDCGKASALVNKYIDDIIDDDERSFINQHLSDCPGCDHGYKFESSFHVRIQSLSPIEMPPDVKENILLALGFPGMTDPSSATFSALGAPDGQLDPDISSLFGIPQGTIPRGEIPRSGFFSSPDDSNDVAEDD